MNADKIFAAICVYMLLGYGWAFVYSILLESQPASFGAISEFDRDDYVGRMPQLRYFSFVTLTRTMAVLEAVMGQFYLVALIGRLVGLHIVHGKMSRSAGRE